MKLLKIMASLSIRPRGFKQENHFSRRNVKLFCVVNSIHVNQETIKGTEKASPIHTLFHR